MSKFFLYGNGGGIDAVKEKLNSNNKITFSEIKDVFNFLAEDSCFCKKGCTEVLYPFQSEDLQVKLIDYDERIGYTVYMITTERYFDEKCYYPRYVRHMIDLDERKT